MAKRLDLNLLHTLEILLAERNVTHAAAKLNTSQPAVSAQLVRLRKMFNDPLLIAGSRGMTPTPRALELAPQLSELLSGFRKIVVPEAFDPATARDTLLISTSDATPCRMASWFGKLTGLAPNIKIGMLPLALNTPSDMENQLASGQVDLGVSLRSTFADRLHVRKLYDEGFVCVLRNDHPFRKKVMTAKDFSALTHVMVSPLSSDFMGDTDLILQKMGLKRNVVASVPSFLVAEKILINSDFLAVFPASVAHSTNTLKSYPLPFSLPSVEVCMGWHERTHHSPVHRWLRDQIAEVFSATQSDSCVAAPVPGT